MESQKLPPKYISPKGMWVTKLTLRIISTTVSVATLSIAGVLVSGPVSSLLPLTVIGPPALIAFCWALAEGICILIRGGHRGIHPGANVAVDLLIWLALISCLAVLGLLGIAATTFGDSLFEITGYYTTYDDDFTDLLASASIKGLAVLGLGGILALLHIATFIIACYETNVRDNLPTFQVISFPTTYSSNMASGMQQAPLGNQPVHIQQMPVQHGQSLPSRAPPDQPVSQSPLAVAVPEGRTESQLPTS